MNPLDVFVLRHITAFVLIGLVIFGFNLAFLVKSAIGGDATATFIAAVGCAAWTYSLPILRRISRSRE